jgi:hypothetical protein
MTFVFPLFFNTFIHSNGGNLSIFKHKLCHSDEEGLVNQNVLKSQLFSNFIFTPHSSPTIYDSVLLHLYGCWCALQVLCSDASVIS